MDGRRVCVVGYGSIGRRHAANALALGAKVCFLRTGLATDGRPRLPPEAATDVDEFFDPDEALAWAPDVVIVANPTAHHLQTAHWALEAGCDVLVEKPLSHELAGLGPLIRRANEAGLVAGTAHQMRFDRRLQRVADLVDSGRLGPIRSAHVEWGTHLPDWHPWEDYRSGYAARRELGGGVVLTCCHELNTIEHLLGPIDSVTARCGSVSSLELSADGCIDAILHHRNGATTLLHLDFFQRPNRRRLRLIGEEGSVEWDFTSPTLTLAVGGQTSTIADWPDPYPFDEDYLRLLADFGAAVRTRRDPLVTLEEGARTVALAEAILRSADAGATQEHPDHQTQETA